MIQTLGYLPEVEQVDFRPCEDGKTTMVYVYCSGGGYGAIAVERQDHLDPEEIEQLLIRGVVPVVVH